MYFDKSGPRTGGLAGGEKKGKFATCHLYSKYGIKTKKHKPNCVQSPTASPPFSLPVMEAFTVTLWALSR